MSATDTVRQRENRKRGLCIWCGAYGDGKSYCEIHREYFRIKMTPYNRRNQQKRRENARGKKEGW